MSWRLYRLSSINKFTFNRSLTNVPGTEASSWKIFDFNIFMAFASIYLVFFVLERVLYLYPFKRIPSSYFSIIEWENLVSLSPVAVCHFFVLRSVLFKRRLSY